MAELALRSQVLLHVTLALTEEEARALDAMAGYGDDAFVTAFYANLGQAYMKTHEAGLRSLLQSARNMLPALLARADLARQVFNGEKETHEPVPTLATVAAAVATKVQQQLGGDVTIAHDNINTIIFHMHKQGCKAKCSLIRVAGDHHYKRKYQFVGKVKPAGAK